MPEGAKRNHGAGGVAGRHRKGSEIMKALTNTKFRGIGSRAQLWTYTALMVVALLLMVASFTYVTIKGGHDEQYIGHAAEQRVLSQSIARHTGEAVVLRESEAFERLQADRDQFALALRYLREGREETGLPGSPETVHDQIAAVEGLWTIYYRDSADLILSLEETIVDLGEAAQEVRSLTPPLIAASDSLVTDLVQADADGSFIQNAGRQLFLIQRMGSNLERVLQGGEGAASAADQLGRDAALFERFLNGLQEGDPGLGVEPIEDPQAQRTLARMAELFGTYSGRIDVVLETSPELFDSLAAMDSIVAGSDGMLATTSALEAAYAEIAEARPISDLTTYGAAGFALAFLLLIGWRLRADGQQAAAEAEETNRRNQQAILQLLDEMGDLASGDLTVEITVTEDFTGAIADSINYAVDELRGLVATVNDASERVRNAARETQSQATQLAEASENQAKEIVSASQRVNEMATSIDRVSNDAGESARVARQSVETANRGAATVQNTIRGMDEIRDQIQETAKRMKRLGESSQEIGDIVGLINDIAEQTNTLALNAAIQAAMAGESGRGFAVVADEVQRLAERAGNATRQIETLVKTIQADTNDAVLAMENTTSEVVEGANRAQEAGKSLEEIETVSVSLAELIERISDASTQQAETAGNVADAMNVIQEIATQSASGAHQTAQYIGELNELAEDLRQKVAGFKLPGGASSQPAAPLTQDLAEAPSRAPEEETLEVPTFAPSGELTRDDPDDEPTLEQTGTSDGPSRH